METHLELEGCRCPGSPHEKDWIDFEPKITASMGMAAQYVYSISSNEADFRGGLAAVFLRFGIRNWSFMDEHQRVLPINTQTIERLLPWDDGGDLAAERAGNLYFEAFTGPLVLKLQKMLATLKPTQPPPLEPGQTAEQMSPASPGKSRIHRRQPRSSRISRPGKPSEAPVR